MPMPDLTNGYVENVPCTSKTRKIPLLIMYVVFLKITTFFVENFSTSSRSYQPILETATIKFGGPSGRGAKVRHMGPRAEDQKKQIPL